MSENTGIYQEFLDSEQKKQNGGVKQQQQNKKSMGSTLSRLLGYTRSSYGLLLLGNIFLLITSGSQIILPRIAGKVIDAITKVNSKQELEKYVLYFLLISVGQAIFSFLRGLCFNLLSERVIAALRNDLFKSILYKDIEFFDSRKTGELLSRIGSDTSVVQSTASTSISELFRSFLQLIGSLILIFLISWQLSLILLALIPLFGFIAIFYSRYSRKLVMKYQDAIASSSSIAEEAISNVRIVKSFSSEDKEIHNYKQLIQQTYQVGKSKSYMYASVLAVFATVGNGSILLVIWYGGDMVLNGTMSPGDLASFMIYTISIALVSSFFAATVSNIITSLGACDRIFEIMDYQPKINSQGGIIINNSNFQGDIQFNNVCFSYPTKSDVETLKNINLHIQVGDVVAVVGSSGGGKSTLVSLLERFYDVKNGQILIDNVNIKELDLTWLHQQIGFVSQEPTLFSGTIEDNIAYGVDIYTEEELHKAMRMANAYDFVNNTTQFPQGLKTLVGERGVQLSGGQKQRIAIARALIKKPKILLFDEATSALDAESEHLVQQAIDTIIQEGNITMIIIAHRLSTIINCNRIIVVSEGNIVEEGTHQELINKNGTYKALIERQIKGYES